MSSQAANPAPQTATHDELANAIRALSMDAVERAKSGHPGMPMGMADVATILFSEFLRFDPEHPLWPNRDLGLELHWMVIPMAVILLLAVGSDYNLLLVSRFKDELPGGLKTGIIRAMAATGSESNPHGVVTHAERQEKLPFFSPLLFPRFAILDPRCTFSLPPRQIGNGVVDAFVHTIEQYLTYPADAPLQDRYAEGLLLTLIEEGPKALDNPEDYNVRANLMWCATQALNGLLGCGVPQDWATHMIGHELTALYHLDHAQTLAVILPALLAERRDSKRAKLLQYAERVWGLRSGSEEERIDGAIKATRDFFERMGIKTRLRDYVADARIDALLA